MYNDSRITRDNTREAQKEARKIVKEVDNGEISGLIAVGKQHGDAGIAHEGGHRKNKFSKNPIVKFIKSRSTKGKKVHKENLVKTISKKQSIVKDLRDTIDSKMLVLEESLASKNGRGLMKEVGYTKDQLERAKREDNHYLKSYKTKSRVLDLSRLYKRIQIPSRTTNTEFIKKDINRWRKN